MCESNISEVAVFYNGKSVFVTGGTGFLGKVLLEKLLFNCNDVEKIYVLVRPKKGVKGEHRINEITEHQVFSRIKKRNPRDMLKIVPVVGDVVENYLGVSKEDMDTLIKNVSVVFHVAATVRFDEPLKKAVEININGTENIMKLCHRMEQLQALVHVSTMYCNTDKIEVQEMVYPAPDPVDHVRYMAERYGDREDVVKMLLGERPNTYTYTKAVAEEVVQKLHGDIPTVIVRPSIVTASHKEPAVGWIDNWNGPTRFVLAVTSGIVRVLYGKPDGVGDFIPVDFVTNFMIVAGTKCQKSSEVKVFNCCTGNTNPITWQKQVDHALTVSRKYGLCKVPLPFTYYVNNGLVYQIFVFFLHVLPAYLMDCWLILIGKKPRNTIIQEKIRTTMIMMSYFTKNDWIFRDHNVRSTLKSLTPIDRQIFNFDVETIDWEKYFADYTFGINTFLMKSKKKN